jgi:hypothetical protein
VKNARIVGKQESGNRVDNFTLHSQPTGVHPQFSALQHGTATSGRYTQSLSAGLSFLVRSFLISAMLMLSVRVRRHDSSD